MGAEVVRLKGADPVGALLDFARSHNVAYIMIGRSYRPRWQKVVKGDVVSRMVQESEGFDLYIVSTEEEEDREP
jgi:two-component system sensor histidine kinase KdpD